MSCCCSCEGTDRFFSKYAGKYARRFRKKGPDKPSRMIVEALGRLGSRGKSVLDVGCGTGDVHLTLLREGASTAEGIDVSAGMLEQAQSLSKELGLEERVAYQEGDFVEQASRVQNADIVVLDKVLCCYEFPDRLLEQASLKTKEFLAISFPSSSILASFSFRLMQWLGRVLRWSFHPFYHDPAELVRLVQDRSFAQVFAGRTAIWQIMVFRRHG